MLLSSLSITTLRQLLARLRTAITYHSNALEGICLTFGETKRLLEHGLTAHNKPLSDQLVVLGFATAYDEVVLAAFEKQPLTTAFIKDLHATLFKVAHMACPENIETPIGAYRRDERYITGIDKSLASPNQMSQLLEHLLATNHAKSMQEIAQFHIDFELIHPFADGNGRIGRLLITYQSILNDVIPPLIENEQRAQYLEALGHPHRLAEFLTEAQQRSYDVIVRDQLM